MKETLRIVMPWVGGCLGLLLLLCALLYAFVELAFDDRGQALCDNEVEAAMKGKASYKLLEVIPDWKESNVEGEGVSSFKYIYRYQPSGYGSDFRVGLLYCNYVDRDHNPVYLIGKKEIN